MGDKKEVKEITQSNIYSVSLVYHYIRKIRSKFLKFEVYFPLNLLSGFIAMATEVKDNKKVPKAHLVGGDSVENSPGKEAFKSPEELAAAQNQENYISPAIYVANLPKVIKRRLKALKKLQVQTNEVEAKFFEELHKLECDYQIKYEPFLQKRADIINARTEPTDKECEWPDDEDDPLSDNFSQMKMNEINEKELPDSLKLDENAKGIPEFWLTIFKNVDMLRNMVQPHDIPILKHLQDIKVHLDTEKGFTLDFLFEENEFFSNPVLTKTYYLKFKPQKDEELLYEGPEVYKCTGVQIDWKANKNVTVRLVKKVQKHKGRGTKRVLTKTVQNESFFNFFNPPEITDEDEVDEETDALLEADFEIGQFIRERIVPRAVLYYTGEVIDEEEDEYDDEDEEGAEDDDEEEEN